MGPRCVSTSPNETTAGHWGTGQRVQELWEGLTTGDDNDGCGLRIP